MQMKDFRLRRDDTNDLETRMQQHYENRGNRKSFAGRYYCYKLLYFERFTDVTQAIEREKEIKDMSRQKKEYLIAAMNPKWTFLLP